VEFGGKPLLIKDLHGLFTTFVLMTVLSIFVLICELFVKRFNIVRRKVVYSDIFSVSNIDFSFNLHANYSDVPQAIEKFIYLHSILTNDENVNIINIDFVSTFIKSNIFELHFSTILNPITNENRSCVLEQLETFQMSLNSFSGEKLSVIEANENTNNN
jgi:hypothetical protein